MIEKACEFDRKDELASFRSKFHFPPKKGKDCIYLCGNSLGLQPIIARDYVQRELLYWQQKGAEGHFTGETPWVSYHLNGKRSLSNMLGASIDEVVAMNNLTTNLHLALASFYRPKGRRTKVLMERGAFPSDFYAVHSQIATKGLDPSENIMELLPVDESDYLSARHIVDTIENINDELALVMFPGIQYYTGQFFDVKLITDAAHRVGAFAGFDLAHAIGNVPMTLHEDNVDFAVWCTYKYLNSGPGGVGGLFIHEKHGRNKKLPRLMGWWGNEADGRFKMDNQINPIPSVDGWQLSNTNVLSHAVHLASLEIFDEAGIHDLRSKSLKLTRYLEELIGCSSCLGPYIEIITPTNPQERGCQLSLRVKHLSKELVEKVKANGVILDWRAPDVMRVAPAPLYNTFLDVYNFVRILEKAVNEK